MATSTAQLSASPASGLGRGPLSGPRRRARADAAYGDEAERLSWPLRVAARKHSISIADALSAGTAASLVLWGLEGPAGATAALVSAIATAVYHAAGGHRRGSTALGGSTLDELPPIAVLAALLTVLLMTLYPGHGQTHLDGWRVAALWSALLTALALGRLTARTLLARMVGPERCLVVGTITEARRIQQRFNASAVKAEVIGTVHPSQLGLEGRIEDLIEALTTVIADVDADRLLVATSGHDERGIAQLVQVARLEGIELTVCSPLLDAAASNANIHHVSGMALMAAEPVRSGRVAKILTRAVDVGFSTVLLVPLAPFFFLIALAVKLDSPGPVFFRQVRVGRHGRNFHILKFRSMVTDAEARKAALRDRSEVGAEMFKLADDPRITRAGRILRRTSLDELPQLLNVLRGDMTLVGPRPLVVEEDATIQGVGRGRLQLTPGMTGPWQVLRERVAQRDMVEIDYGYVTNRSLWVDVKILARTALHVMRSGNV